MQTVDLSFWVKYIIILTNQSSIVMFTGPESSQNYTQNHTCQFGNEKHAFQSRIMLASPELSLPDQNHAYYFRIKLLNPETSLPVQDHTYQSRIELPDQNHAYYYRIKITIPEQSLPIQKHACQSKTMLTMPE